MTLCDILLSLGSAIYNAGCALIRYCYLKNSLRVELQVLIRNFYFIFYFKDNFFIKEKTIFFFKFVSLHLHLINTYLDFSQSPILKSNISKWLPSAQFNLFLRMML